MIREAFYNTTDTGTGDLPLQQKETVTIGPIITTNAQNVVGTIFADQSGTLAIQQSFDGEHWDIDQTFAISASMGQGFEVPALAPEARLVFTNGSINQTVMRLFARTSIQGT